MHQLFNDIYRRYYQKAILFVKSYVRDEMAAEDIVSESMVSLWNMLRNETVANPQALLLSILKNTALNYLKHQAIRQEVMENVAAWAVSDLRHRLNTLEACDPEEVYTIEITRIVEKTLSSLSPQTRRVFEMRRYDTLPVKKIAEMLSMPPKTIEYHLTKALKALHIALKDYMTLFF
ncbi:MAG: RNA polymerase sigma-70 factor [Tannerella sp.]|jgi:RNA polymerase sigma-70 factor (ECF subfamily)|nr:RNA polymerase sigma-70 factor [Tannerella sp.]